MTRISDSWLFKKFQIHDFPKHLIFIKSVCVSLSKVAIEIALCLQATCHLEKKTFPVEGLAY